MQLRHKVNWMMFCRLLLILALPFTLAGPLAFWCAEADEDDALRIAWGPVLGDVTQTSAQFTFKLNMPGRAAIAIDGRFVVERTPSIFHRITVRGLQPGRRYKYQAMARIAGKLVKAEPAVFRTVAPDEAQLQFVALGDSRSRPEEFRRLLERMSETSSPAFIIHTGDIVADGREEELWDKEFFAAVGPYVKSTPIYTALGNHERNSDIYYRALPFPTGGGQEGHEWYSFRRGNALFVALDSCREQDAQTRWVDELLANRPPDIDWVIVFFHYPLWSTSKRNGTPELRDKWAPLFAKYGVDFVFTGHDHLYQRDEVDGLTHVITGGAGAPLYDVFVTEDPYVRVAKSTLHYCEVTLRGKMARMRVIDADGNVIDAIEKTKP